MAFPMTTIGDLEISRMLCGTNSFFGYSHMSKARDAFLRRHFTAERIVEVLAAMAEEGINGTVSSPNQKMREALDVLEDQTGHTMHWIATPHGDDLDELKHNIRECADLGAAVCMPHTSYTDSHLHISEDRIDGAGEICEMIRELGMIPGWSTHRPEVIGVTMRAGYDIETIIQPFNPIGFLCAVETDWMARTINSFPGTVISIKPLAAGRILPPTGISFAYSHLDDRHTVCIGCMSPEEAKEDIALARACIQGTDPEVELQKTRSKETLG